jgi:hypothetical protein
VATLSVTGGSNRLAFDRAGASLAVGSEARYVAMWSVGSWEKIFQLNTLVGVRSVYGFHPTRGDLAFDGENGQVRLLPRWTGLGALAVHGVLQGMAVTFDQIPSNIARDEDAEVIRSVGLACPTC